MSEPGPSGRAFWIALALGWAVMAYGVVGALSNAGRTSPVSLAIFVVAFAVLHDAVVAPLAFAAGWVLTRFLPPFARGPVRGALALSVLLLVFSVPLVRTFGVRPTDASALPLDYGRNLLIVLAAVWTVTALVMLRRRQTDRRAPTPHAG